VYGSIQDIFRFSVYKRIVFESSGTLAALELDFPRTSGQRTALGDFVRLVPAAAQLVRRNGNRALVPL
jgi:hypothetical protein